MARIDQPLLDWMVGHRSPGLDGVVTFFTDIGGTTVLPILMTLVVAGLAWWWRSWTPVVLMAVAAAGSVAMTETGKDLAGRASSCFTSTTGSDGSSPCRRSSSTRWPWG